VLSDMNDTIQPIRGMNDVLPGDSGAWQLLERVAREVFAEYGYREIRLPLLERTELFKRSIGEMTDIVEKEMYTFEDRGGDSVTLRPEATAGIVRACVTNGLLHNQRQKLWCAGPMFRYERPQKGRYRQFHQIDVEALGFPGPDVDAELILMSARIWRRLGLEGLRLDLNSLGTPQSRRGYRETLTEYFRGHAAALDEDSRRRLDGNPLRILDSKNPAMCDVIAGAPLITDHLDPESAEHFARLRAHLDAAGIAYVVNPRLVRGLDYYARTVFEWVTSDLGSQDAVCSGGRYDGLVAQLGGGATPAIGWALGEERIVELLRLQQRAVDELTADVYLVLAGAPAEATGLRLAEQLRDALPGLRIETNCGAGSFKSQMKRADRSGARYAVILGEEEVARGVVALKPLREEAGQGEVPVAGLATELSRLVAGAGDRNLLGAGSRRSGITESSKWKT
jgi:histidyl-tRNA synthetase